MILTMNTLRETWIATAVAVLLGASIGALCSVPAVTYVILKTTNTLLERRE